MSLTPLDLVLLLVLALAAFTGYRAGASRQVGGLLGAAAGLVVGGGVAQAVTDRVGEVSARPWVVFLVVLVVCIALGALIGRSIGGVIRRGADAVFLGWIDGVLGALVRVTVVLVVAWLAARVAVSVGSPPVQQAVRDSTVVSTVDETMTSALPERLPGPLSDGLGHVTAGR